MALVLAITLPIIPILVQIKDGYHIPETSSGPICIGRNTSHMFYAFLLPFSILSATITTVLVLNFWKILKVIISMCVHSAAPVDRKCDLLYEKGPLGVFINIEFLHSPFYVEYSGQE